LRDFLSRAFSVDEVEGVELRRATAFGRIRYGAVPNPSQIWKKLSRALTSEDDALSVSKRPARRIDARLVYLDAPGVTPVRVSRIGDSLSTWRVRHQGENTLRLSHPLLRNRRDVVYRLEEELAAIFGIEDFRASALTAGVSIRFDSSALSAEHLARELEKAWPRLLEGLDGPPSRKRLVAAVGLTGLAFTGQYLVPALKPLAVAGVAIYSAPNVINAAKQLARGEVGLSAMYSAGLGFMLISGMPFASAVIASLMQLWPHLARETIVRSQRRLFAGQRRRPLWARVPQADGTDVEVYVDELRKGDLILVQRGEIIPVDGVVEDGHAAVMDAAAFGELQIEDKSKGDAVAAGAFIRHGNLTIRVERIGADTTASYIDSLLPHGVIAGMPSSLEAERIANRNAKPALALAALSLLLTRTLRPSQVLIRPDYATAPRLSAQLSSLHGVADALQRGVVFKNPASLDRLAAAEIYILDDTAGLDRRRLEVATVQTIDGVSADLVVGYAAAAHRESTHEQSRALASFAGNVKTVQPNAESVFRYAGVTRYQDTLGSEIEVATAQYLSKSEIEIPKRLQTVPARHLGTSKAEVPSRAIAAPPRQFAAPASVPAPAGSVEAPRVDDPALRPLYVVRDSEVIGVVSFARTGEVVGTQAVAALKSQIGKDAQIVYLSHREQAETHALARTLGLELSHGGLTRSAKLDFVRGLGRSTVWIGNGSDPDVRETIAASTVSISVAPLASSRDDAADILLPQRGLDALNDVFEIGRAHVARIAQDYRTVYAVNLVSLSGLLATRFGSLHAGLLSNVSTGLIYARHARSLDKLASAAEEKHALLKSAVLA
jgi:cation transport ATPase